MMGPTSAPRRWRVSLLAVAALLLAALPTAAEVEERTTELEIYVGGYFPGPEEIQDEPTYGFRFGYNFTQAFNLTAALGFLRTDIEIEGGWPRDRADYEVTLVDLSALWNVNPDSRWTFVLFGGPGYSWIASDIGLGGTVEQNGFTVNGGAGLKISINDRIYLKVAGLARWFERREADDIDGEISLAAGFQLGG
jgi:hypothetical protein